MHGMEIEKNRKKFVIKLNCSPSAYSEGRWVCLWMMSFNESIKLSVSFHLKWSVLRFSWYWLALNSVRKRLPSAQSNENLTRFKFFFNIIAHALLHDAISLRGVHFLTSAQMAHGGVLFYYSLCCRFSLRFWCLFYNSYFTLESYFCAFLICLLAELKISVAM